jgi:hypothetical protein
VVLGILVLKNLFVFSLFLLAFALRLDDICSVILDNETRLQCRDVWGKKSLANSCAYELLYHRN